MSDEPLQPPHMTSHELARERLPMWVIYDHPSDFPNHYLARLHFSLPEPEATPLAVGCASLEGLRRFLEWRGCTRLERQPDDDPVILEVWLV